VLFNVFLDMSQSQTGTSVSFALDLCVRVPQYEVDGALFLKDHYEGGYLYRDTIMLEAVPPSDPAGRWRFDYAFLGQRAEPRRTAEAVDGGDGSMSFEIPIEQPHPPGIRARLRVKTSYWNDWQ
jgi:hypothetical protein